MTKEQIKAKAKEQFPNDEFKQQIVINAINWSAKELEKENADLKCECRRCVYTDSPCILSDYGKDRNGICDHFKDVFDENTELKEELEEADNATDCFNKQEEIIAKAKELLGYIVKYYRDDEDLGLAKEINEAEQFLNSEVEK